MKTIFSWLQKDRRRSFSMGDYLNSDHYDVELRIYEHVPSSQWNTCDRNVVMVTENSGPFLAVSGSGKTVDAAFKDALKRLAEHFK
jgi:hypothetical protein